MAAEVNGSVDDPAQNVGINGEFYDSADRGLKRKADDAKSSLYLCDVCQVTLNSPSQAIQHYKGKNHLARLQGSHNDSAMLLVSESTTNPLSWSSMKDSARFKPPSGTQPHVMHQTSTAGPISLPPNPVVHNLYCNMCGKSFNSQIQAQQHYNGKQHKLKEKQKLEAKPVETFPDALVIPSDNSAGSSMVQAPSGIVTSKGTVKLGSNIKAKLFRCEACNITLNSELQFDQHNRGLRHKMMTGQVTAPPAPEDEGWQGFRYRKLAKVVNTVDTPTGAVMVPSSTPGGTRLGLFYCETCNLSVNSQSQLQQHLSGEKHKMRLSGEGPRPPVTPRRGAQTGPRFPGGKTRGGFRGQYAGSPGPRLPTPRLPSLYKSFISGGEWSSSVPPLP